MRRGLEAEDTRLEPHSGHLNRTGHITSATHKKTEAPWQVPALSSITSVFPNMAKSCMSASPSGVPVKRICTDRKRHQLAHRVGEQQ